MAKGKKTNSETKAKIIATKINNPDLSSRDIEDRTGTAHETVAKVLREDLAQVCTQSENIAKLIDSNNMIIAAADIVINEKIGEEKAIDAMRIKDMAIKQNRLVQEKSTENIDYNITIKFDD